MARYTAVLDRTFEVSSRDRVLVVEANAGSVTIEINDGVNWILVNSIAVDSANTIVTRGLRMRFSPVGGAVFLIGEE